MTPVAQPPSKPIKIDKELIECLMVNGERWGLLDKWDAEKITQGNRRGMEKKAVENAIKYCINSKSPK